MGLYSLLTASAEAIKVTLRLHCILKERKGLLSRDHPRAWSTLLLCPYLHPPHASLNALRDSCFTGMASLFSCKSQQMRPATGL